MKKFIRNWKVLRNKLNFNDAYSIYLEEKEKGNIRAIRIGGRIFYPGVKDIEYEHFNVRESVSYEWEILEPDFESENYLEKLREILKNDHFHGLSNNKLDTMDIKEIWNYIMDNVLFNIDNIAKYRIIKHIVENKLYKKS